MKILHTSDWHLGQRFCERDRSEEHQAFLTWLLALIREEQVDALVHAGDVFDVGNPPSYALEMYYNFLHDLSKICQNIIITGGNHDSPSTLNAPKSLLKRLHVHVVGAVTDNLSDEKIGIKAANGEEIGVVCAVPFLRDKDVRYSVFGESADEREQRIREGIRKHYEAIAESVAEEKKRGLPIIATGHLFAAGSEISDIEHSVVGNLGQVSAETFPEIFDYVALGHIHKPQIIGKKEHIRYCGSPIPLSFSEISHPHTVIIVEFQEGKLVSLNKIEVPRTRKLLRFEGTPEEIIQKIQNFTNDDILPAWIETIAMLDAPNPQWVDSVKKAATGKNLEFLRFSVKKTATASLSDLETERNLQNLTEVDVFRLLCEAKNFPPETRKEYEQDFNELLSLLREDVL